MQKVNTSSSFFGWKLNPHFSFGVLLSFSFMSFILGIAVYLFTEDLFQNLPLTLTYISLYIISFFFMIITSWSSPGSFSNQTELEMVTFVMSSLNGSQKSIPMLNAEAADTGIFNYC